MTLREQCENCKLQKYGIYNCPFYAIPFTSGITGAFKKFCKNIKPIEMNTVVRFNNNNFEILKLNKKYSCTGNTYKGPRNRLWVIENGVLRKTDINNEKATLPHLKFCRLKNLKRALDVFLSYGQNNDWSYFITMTFDPHKIDSTSQDSVKYAWKLFRQKLQYYFHDIKILAVIEYHKDENKLHFHGAIGNADLSKVLCRAINNEQFLKNKDGTIKLDKFGKPVWNPFYLKPLQTIIGDKIYNFMHEIFNLGFCSVIPLKQRDNNNITSFDKVIFYLAKYMNKDKSAVPYGAKSYFHTHNLNKGTKTILNLSDEEFLNLINKLEQKGLYMKKTRELFSSYLMSIEEKTT